MDKGNAVGMVLLDLQKALDTVDHSILLTKLEAIGLSNDIVKLFQSYLSVRQQLVDVATTFSPCAKIMWCFSGVNTWTFVVLIYVKDMSGVIRNKLLLYSSL